jgi:hypothetical protein
MSLIVRSAITSLDSIANNINGANIINSPNLAFGRNVRTLLARPVDGE